jgi:hypothetical protein
MDYEVFAVRFGLWENHIPPLEKHRSVIVGKWANNSVALLLVCW